MGGKRILDRFVMAGRKLSEAEREAVNAMHAKYPNVEFKAKPARYKSDKVRNGSKY
jgi:hypothetical protein